MTTRPRRAQAFIEIVALTPVLVGVVFLMVAYWSYLARSTDYTRAATHLAEWIGREGIYDASLMCPQFRSLLGDGVDCDGDDGRIFLHVTVAVVGDVGDLEVHGTSVSDAGDQVPDDQGWSTDSDPVEGDSIVSVDIWSYQQLASLFADGPGPKLVPMGHAVSIATLDLAS